MEKQTTDGGKDRTAQSNTQRVAEIVRMAYSANEPTTFTDETAELLLIYNQQRVLCKRLQRFVEATQENPNWKYTDVPVFLEAYTLAEKVLADVVADFIIDDVRQSETANDERERIAAEERTKYEQARKEARQ